MQDLIREYQAAADKLESRIKELTKLRKQARGNDAVILEKRIEVLQKEYWDICDTIGDMSLSQKR